MSLLLSISGREDWFPHLGPSLHASVVKSPAFFEPLDADVHRKALVVWNALLKLHVTRGELAYALKMFDEMPMRNTSSRNEVLSGLLKNREIECGFVLLKSMLRPGGFDQATLTMALSVCDTPELCLVTKMIHGLAVLSGCDKDITAGGALISRPITKVDVRFLGDGFLMRWGKETSSLGRL